MRKCCALFACLIAFGIASARSYDPIPEITALIAYLNADSLSARVQHLQNYQTRYAQAGNQQEIAAWLAGQFQSYGFSNTYLQEYQQAGTTQYNVIATIPGSLHPERYIIVSAHYDSQALDSNAYVWAPGADDNASGTAGLLEMARVMMLTGYQARCTIRFIAFSAEEIGAWGSEHYCAYAQSENHDIRVMVNLDMIGSNQPVTNEFRVVPFTDSPLHCREAITFAGPYSNLQPVEGPMNYGGDGMIFNAWGYPAVMFIERHLSPYWHTADDVIGHLDFQYALQMLRAATATTAIFANQPPELGEITVSDTGTGNSLLAQWDSSDDPELSHYAVFYGTEPDAMLLWQNTGGTQCLISGLEEGQYCHIAVAAVNSDGYPGLRSYAGATPLSVPRTPQLLADHPTSASIVITWLPNAELDLAGYTIYRGLGPQGPLEAAGTVLAPATSFTDLDVSSNLEYYYYRLRAFDTQGQQSQLSDALTSRMVSLDRGIFVVDESKNFSGTNPFLPTDQAVDDFYAQLLNGYGPLQHLDLEDFDGSLRLADIGVYSSILWHGNDNSDYSYPYQIREVLRQYIFWGGQVLFSVYFPSKAFELNAGYPAVFAPGSFMYDVLGVGGVGYSVGARFKQAVSNQANYPSMQVDALKTLAAFNGHIIAVEGLEPLSSQESIYLYASDYDSASSQGVLNGSSVGIHRQYGAGQVICLSFPLYNMQVPEAEEFADYVFGSVFNEASAAPGNTVPPIPGLTLSRSYPNPFRFQTAFTVQAPDRAKLLKIGIYNLRGQLIRPLYQGYPDHNARFVWDGKDANGNPVGSGIYLIKASAGAESVIAKILKLR